MMTQPHPFAAHTGDKPTVRLDVLVVDDDETTRATLAELLRDAGHRVTLAVDGAEAMDLAAERAFDVVICDVGLPKVSGLLVFHQLRRDSPATEVILMTGWGVVPDAVELCVPGHATT